MNPRRVSSTLYLDQVNHNELLMLLLWHFGHSSHQPLSQTFHFQKQSDAEADLVVEVNKKGRIARITVAKSLTDEELVEISRKVKETLVDNQSEKVGEVVAFTVQNRVEGAFQHRDEFQLLPVPHGSPQPRQLVAEHPFLVRFRYLGCPDVMIDGMRQKEREVRLLRLLSFFTQGVIRDAGPSGEFAWVLKAETAPLRLTSEYRQRGYVYQGRSGNGGAFSPLTGLPAIDTIPPEQYFRQYGYSSCKTPHVLALPRNLSDLFDRTERLSPDDHSKFFMACTWFYYSYDLWMRSHSASFMALITALECLMGKPVACDECSSPIKGEVERCEKCGEPKFKLNKTFREFLERYVPFIDQLPAEKKQMYQLRSQLTHGLTAFSRDIEPGVWMSLKNQEQDELHRSVNYITFVAIYNWLLSRPQQIDASAAPSIHYP
jgi:hypothetical protein